MPSAGLQSCNSIHQQICREREKVANFSTRQTAIAQKFYTLITKLYTYDNDKNIDNNNSEGFFKNTSASARYKPAIRSEQLKLCATSVHHFSTDDKLTTSPSHR